MTDAVADVEDVDLNDDDFEALADDTPIYDPHGVHRRFLDLRKSLNDSLVERNDEVEAMLLGLIAGEHVLLVGPPGTGKSMLCENLTKAVHDAESFTVLLTKFSTPEELFGPISVKGLKEDRYERKTDSFLPHAHVAFVDEIWKASSAILNTLLRIMNEREFINGTSVEKCPMKIMLAASNEWPQGEELSAAFDRFLIRKTVKTVRGEANRRHLMFGALCEVGPLLSLGDVDAAKVSASAICWSTEAKEALDQILGELHKEGVDPGDRRLRKSVALAQAAAWLAGASEVQPDHLECLQWTLWNVPGEQSDKTSEVVCKIANPVGAEITSIVSRFEDVAKGMPEDAVDGEFISGMRKLEDLYKEIKSLAEKNPSDRANQVAAYVKDSIKRFRIKAIDA